MSRTAPLAALLIVACITVEPAPPMPDPRASIAAPGARARDLGVPFEGTPGAWNAITDVPGVLVGQRTLVRGDGAHAVRTGVTAILPRAELGYYPAATFVLNGDGEMLGAAFAEDFGMLRAPILLTGTWSTGTAYNAVLKWCARRFLENPVHLPVIADTWDGDLSAG
jgi:D-aminopeptidase